MMMMRLTVSGLSNYVVVGSWVPFFLVKPNDVKQDRILR